MKKLRYKGYTGVVRHYPESNLYRIKVRRGLHWICNISISLREDIPTCLTYSELESIFREDVDSYLKRK